MNIIQITFNISKKLLHGSSILIFLFFAFTPRFIQAQELTRFKNEVGMYGYKNAAGNIVVKAKYMSASDFSEGLAAVWNGKGGYIDGSGKEIIPLQYAMTQSFQNGIAKVYNGTEWFYINKLGQRVNHTANNQKPTSTASKFSIFYTMDRSPNGKLYVNNIIQYIKDHGIINQMIERLNATFVLPHNINITFKWLGTINAYYDPNDKSINFGLEMVDFIYTLYSKYYSGSRLDEAVNNSVVFFLFHEVGHALKHIYDLPLRGNQEAAVDDFACFLLTNRQDENTEKAALDGANTFILFSKANLGSAPYWDEHPFDEQRFFAILCQLYGKNPTKYNQLVMEYKLPESWKLRCVEEYSDMIKSWNQLLKTHYKQGKSR